MAEQRPAFGRPARGIAFLAGLVLLFGLVATGVHDHAREDGSHPCAICSLSHAPATVTAVVIGSASAPRVERVTVVPQAQPRDLGPASPSSRAPPQA